MAKTIKKYVPLFVLIFIFSLYLVSQGVFNLSDPTANPVAQQKKQYAHYESMLKAFKGKDIEGNSVEFKKMPKVVIMNFWASWCTPCLEEFPSLVKMVSDYKDKDIKIIGINTDENDQLKEINKIKSKYNLNFSIIADKNSRFVNKFMIDAIPVSIIYVNGKVHEVSQGAKDFTSGEFREQLNSWL